MRFRWICSIYLCAALHTIAGDTLHFPAVLPPVSEESLARSAYQFLSEGRNMEALEIYHPLADQGNADANFLMAYVADVQESSGSKGPSRLQAMALHYGKAASAGHKEAPLRLLLMDMRYGSEEQRNTAREKLESAANSENQPAACRVFGEAWLKGCVSGEVDSAKAIQWWSKAAELGDESVLVPLGALILREKQNPEDEAIARKWLEKAIEHGKSDAFLVMGNYESDDRKEPDAARNTYLQGAQAGQSDCMLKLAEILRKDHPEESRTWLEKSSAAGNPKARYFVAKELLTKGGDEKKSAYPLLVAAANDGVWQAQYDLAMLLLDGKMGSKDPVAAAAWLTKAAASGDAETQYQLGILHEWGYTGSVNYSNVGILYTLASQGGHAKAAGRLARMASDGIRVKSNPPQAWAYAKVAVERGDESTRPLYTALDGKLASAEREQATEIYSQILGETRAVPEKPH